MTTKRKPDPFRAIAIPELEAVTGGRLSTKKGPDPEVLAGIKQLGEVIAAVGQKLSADQAGGQQQMMQMMQQMMQSRGGR